MVLGGINGNYGKIYGNDANSSCNGSSSNDNNGKDVFAAWVSQLADGKDSGASDLLHHLPLLRPANTEAKMQYLSLIPKVRTRSFYPSLLLILPRQHQAKDAVLHPHASGENFVLPSFRKGI